MAETPVKAGDVLAGKYQVERILGTGGMGIVVAAWHQELERRVAVKFLLPEIAERSDAAERFRREARAAVKIRSEHVARVLDVGTLDGVAPYMVMEYLDGHDLAEELRTRGMLPVHESLEFLLQAAEAVAEAHSAGIVHRDLKPANLFVTARGDGTRAVKVLDFGISKSVLSGSVNDLSLTRTSSLIGSPLYMSPEQMKSAREVDSRTDIWALGVILYEMLAGRPPYVAESIPQLCSALLHDSPPPLSQFRSDVPAGLEHVILRCLAKDRTQRWPTVADLAQNLAPFAPPYARIHADRARRVLGSTEVSIDQPDLSGQSNSVVTLVTSQPAGGGSGSAAVQANPLPTVNSPGVPHRPGTTEASWGRTGDPEAVQQARKRRRAVAITLSAVALVGVAGLGLYAIVQPPAAANGVNVPAPAAVAVQPAAAERGTSPAAPEGKPAAVVPEITPVTAEPAAAAQVTAADAGNKTLVRPKTRLAAAPARPARTPRPRGEPAETPAEAQRKSAQGSITDFGGRR
ncbi:MAG TPA: serine/threonine-protein kinase [Polyangiaceae bacterium]